MPNRGYLSERGVDYFKPPKFAHWLTLSELEAEVGKDKSWIKKLERAGKIKKAKRFRRGALHIRLYSPEDVQEIKEYFATQKPGKKPKKV